MNSEENRAIALRWFDEVWNQRRTATIDELLAPGCVGHMEGFDTCGPEDFKDMRAILLSAFPDLRMTIEETIAEGSSVVSRWHVEATHRGASLGIAPTGRRVAFRGMSQQRIVDGRIVEGWDSWNQGALMSELRQAASPQA